MKLCSIFTALLLVMAATTASADPPSLLKSMFGRGGVEADSSKTYELSEEDGPWLILASTFVGENSKQRAERLVHEIRKEMGLPAFLYKENFDFTGTVKSDPRTARQTRYWNRYQYDGYAVLVGEYDTSEHPSIEDDLKRVKTTTLPVFSDPNEVAAETSRSNPVTTVKAITSKLLKSRKDSPIGPMGLAFLTRNPMLPAEFFETPVVDSFVNELNDGVPHTLLKCKGKYTVIVKTFQGIEAIVDGKQEKKFSPSVKRMDKYASVANKMTLALRKKGVEAYQFHDRFRSLVTVGSFQSLGRELPGGGFEYDPGIKAVMQKYSALNVRPELARQVPRDKKGRASNNVAMIPFDVQPTPIAVPKTSKRSLYGTKLGMR